MSTYFSMDWGREVYQRTVINKGVFAIQLVALCCLGCFCGMCMLYCPQWWRFGPGRDAGHRWSKRTKCMYPSRPWRLLAVVGNEDKRVVCGPCRFQVAPCMSNQFLQTAAHRQYRRGEESLSMWIVYSAAVRRLGGVRMKKARAVSQHFTLHFHVQRRYGNATCTNGVAHETLDFTLAV